MNGLCECGCGNITRKHERDDKRDGSVKGEYKRYVNGHQNIGRHAPKGPSKDIRYIIDDNTGCWNWILSANGKYGQEYEHGTGSQSAHRLYYIRAKGTIPEGLELDHLCRNTLCVNPDHLEAVTRAENIRRAPRTLLTFDKVIEIRKRFETEDISKARLAREYGVARTTISSIFTGKNWKDTV